MRSLARDDFNGSALSNAWVKNDSENKITVSGGAVVVSGGKAIPAFDDPRLTYTRASFLPQAGLTFECEMTFTAFGANGCDFGFDKTNPVSDGLQPGFQAFAGGVLRAIQAQGAIARQATPVTLALNVPHRFKVVLLDPQYGVMWLYSADQGKTWTPVFVDSQYPTTSAPLYMGFTNNDAAFTVSYMHAYMGTAYTPALNDTFNARTGAGRADTGQPWLGASGKAIPLIAGDMRVPPGSTESWLAGWDGVSDGVWSGDLNFGSAPNTQKSAFIVLRQRDQSNYTRITFNRAGQQIGIVRVANNVATSLATLSAAGLADNTAYKMRVAAFGPVIVVYQDGVEKVRGSEAFGQYFGLCSFYLNDNLAIPDARWDNVRAWGFPMRPLFADSFDRPDDTASLGIADTGQSYTPFTDVANIPVFGIESGRAMNVSAGGPGSNDRMARTPALARSSFMAWAIIRTTAAQQGYEGLLLRAIDSQNWAALRVQSAGATNFLGVFKDVAGVRAGVTTTGLPAPLVANQDYVVAVELYGNSYEHWFDGVHYAGVGTLPDFPSNPAAGVYVTSGVSGRIDDLRYVPIATMLAHDTFTRVDSAVTMGNTETPGTQWEPQNGAVLGISGSKAYVVTNDAGGRAFALVPTMLADGFVQADVTFGTGNPGICFRGEADWQNMFSFHIATTANTVSLADWTGGAPTVLQSVGVTIAAGQTYTLRVEYKGTSIKCYVNGALLIDTTSALHAAGRRVGFRNLVNATNRIDNFVAGEAAA